MLVALSSLQGKEWGFKTQRRAAEHEAKVPTHCSSWNCVGNRKHPKHSASFDGLDTQRSLSLWGEGAALSAELLFRGVVGAGFAISPVYHQLQQHHVGVLGEFGVVLGVAVPLQQRHQVQVAGHFIGEFPRGETHGPSPGGDVGDGCLQVPQVGP